MAFRVLVSRRAGQDIDEGTSFIARDSAQESSRWLQELQELILTLSEMPGKFSLIPEAADLKRPLRSVRHYSHRVIFLIDEATNAVLVVRVFHMARKPLSKKDLPSD
jgi:plasmid stabilization system protein ParE